MASEDSYSADRSNVGELLARFRPVTALAPIERDNRQRLAEFIRSVEGRFHRAPAAVAARMRQMIGWDDESLHRFINAPLLVHSSTHVSMNAFAPMVTFPWFCLRTMTEAAGRPDGGSNSHLRTLLTHNNLSDNRWKPHVWWRADDQGRLARTQLFSKQPRFKHRILLRQSVPEIVAGDLGDADRRALELARHTTNFAYFAAVYRLSLEREVGLHVPGGTVEVPLDLVNAFALSGPNWPQWREALYDQGLPLRHAGTDQELYPVTR
jgi:hypothetical protein